MNIKTVVTARKARVCSILLAGLMTVSGGAMADSIQDLSARIHIGDDRAQVVRVLGREPTTTEESRILAVNYADLYFRVGIGNGIRVRLVADHVVGVTTTEGGFLENLMR